MQKNEEKKSLEELKEELFFKKTNISIQAGESEQCKILGLSEDYKFFLNNAKTEREIVNFVKYMALAAGFNEFNNVKYFEPGDKFFKINRDKNIFLVVIGDEGAKNGINLVVSHIDSPRLDLKPNPLYESNEFAYLKTHYYGGIKKYQWTTLPLAIHGKIIKKDGSEIEIIAGEVGDDYCFCISDLLPHLAAEQVNKSMSKAITGEDLNLIVGSIPMSDFKFQDSIKLNILNILNKKYGITETDFVFSELQIVPSIAAKDVGFDKSLIGSYGHDDRCCSFSAVKAFLEIGNCTKTSVLSLFDKEEIGSEGNTGAKSSYFRHFIKDLIEHENIKTRDIFPLSKCISADVEAAYDPSFSDSFDANNSSRINHGVVVTKYTGRGGKSGASDASTEMLKHIRKILDENNIKWQSGILGKVDTGGGGTVAKYFAQLNIDVIDIGIPVLSMHSPFEIISKYDLYEYYKFIKSFVK